MGLRSLVALLLAATVAAVATGARVEAHPADVIVTGTRAGPLVMGETTLTDAKDWFGSPDSLTKRRYQCIRVITAVWPGLRLKFSQELQRLVEIKIRAHEIVSFEHGRLRFHTRRGLRVGDTLLHVHQKYPDAPFYTHDLHIHHVLHLRFPVGRVEATTRLGLVTELLVAPWELC